MPIQFQNNLEATTYPALPHSHLCFGYKLPVWHVPPGLVSAAAKDRAALHIHWTHSWVQPAEPNFFSRVQPPRVQPGQPRLNPKKWKIESFFGQILYKLWRIACGVRRLRSKSPSACCAPETRWLGGSFLLVYRNNAGRLGSGFISACLETRWLGHLGGFYVPERPCTYYTRAV